MGMSCEMTTRLGGELQQPITGITFGWEKILEWKSNESVSDVSISATDGCTDQCRKKSLLVRIKTFHEMGEML